MRMLFRTHPHVTTFVNPHLIPLHDLIYLVHLPCAICSRIPWRIDSFNQMVSSSEMPEDMKYSSCRTKSGCPRGDIDIICSESAEVQTGLPEVWCADRISLALQRLEEADIWLRQRKREGIQSAAGAVDGSNKKQSARHHICARRLMCLDKPVLARATQCQKNVCRPKPARRGPIGAYGDLWGSMGTMGAYGDLWGPMGTYGGLWGPIGAYGGIRGPIGTYRGLWGPLGTYWHLFGPRRTYCDQWGPMATYGDLWVPMGNYGDPWGPIGTHGDLWGPMGSFGDL